MARAARWCKPGPAGPFPPWLRATVGRCGVYAIRSVRSGEVMYVGESHTGRLYETLTRHLQFWKGPKAGPTYERSDVEVKIRVTRGHSRRCPQGMGGRRYPCECGAMRAAINLQDDWICRLDPVDNLAKGPCEEIPF